MINIMIYDILDKIIQYFCKHDKKWQLEQEISRSKSWTKTFTCSYKYNIEYEVNWPYKNAVSITDWITKLNF